jgi:primary-amine oxidase
MLRHHALTQALRAYMMPLSSLRIARVLLSILPVVFATRSASSHPLDPLSVAEIANTVATLQEAGYADSTTRFAFIGLDEPRKSETLAWLPGQPVSRNAFVVARRARIVYDGVVDLDNHRVLRWRSVPNAQTAIIPSEWHSAQEITISDSSWQMAVRRRGYDPDRTAVFCAPLPVGHAASGRRLVNVVCFDTSDTRNVWSHPIEGLIAVVDLDAHRVIRLLDTGPVPHSRAPDESADGAKDQAKTGGDAVPPAPDIAVEGNMVSWKNWWFHVRTDQRTGPVLSLVQYKDEGHPRMVLYRGSLAEMFVPYMDPTAGWSFRNYMDVGEFGIGTMSLPLVAGTDCPIASRLVDAIVADEYGKAHVRNGVICLFERDPQAPSWRHAEIANNLYISKKAVELVIRTIATLGNYDYVIDWVLTEGGTIRIDVGTTGIDQVKGVDARTLADKSAPRDTAYGNLVASNLVGVNHDHFLSFRLDVDIDGPNNTLVEQKATRFRLHQAGRRSLWRLIGRDVKVEGALHEGMLGPTVLWRVENRERVNMLGEHPGYELRPGHIVTSLLEPDDIAQRRAAFSNSPLWVTAYDAQELYAAGPYPNQSQRQDGLPRYTARRRPVVDTDIVLWYTMGFRHVTRPEDWPILPTVWHSMSLVPYGFFSHNPTFDQRQ